jgi:hypothetical protein
VVTGGFEKRPASAHAATLAGASSVVNYAVHAIYRDLTEQYIVLLPGDGTILVYDALTGAQKTVNAFSGTIASYITGTLQRLRVHAPSPTSTFIVNRTKVTAMAGRHVTVTITGNKTSLQPTSLPATAFAWAMSTGSPGQRHRRWTTTTSPGTPRLVEVGRGCQPERPELLRPRRRCRTSSSRNNDGTFTLSTGRVARPPGGRRDDRQEAELHRLPALSDIYFHRNRLGVIGREFCLPWSDRQRLLQPVAQEGHRGPRRRPRRHG